jgi:hypothetical protein
VLTQENKRVEKIPRFSWTKHLYAGERSLDPQTTTSSTR